MLDSRIASNSALFIGRPKFRLTILLALAPVALVVLIKALGSQSSGDRLFTFLIFGICLLAIVVILLAWLLGGRETLEVDAERLVIGRSVLGIPLLRRTIATSAVSSTEASSGPVQQRLGRNLLERHLTDGEAAVIIRSRDDQMVWSGAWRLTTPEAESVSQQILRFAPQASNRSVGVRVPAIENRGPSSRLSPAPRYGVTMIAIGYFGAIVFPLCFMAYVIATRPVGWFPGIPLLLVGVSFTSFAALAYMRQANRAAQAADSAAANEGQQVEIAD